MSDYNIDYSLSLADLMLVDGFKEAFGRNDKTAIETVLRQHGMNVKAGYDTPVVTHRTLSGKEVTCLRYEGIERLDKRWIASGAASLDAIIASCSDPHMRVQLKTMSRRELQDMYWKELED